MKYISLVFVFALVGCSGAGGMQTYQDYPWGNYSWESDHNHRTNPADAQDDFNRYFGNQGLAKPAGG